MAKISLPMGMVLHKVLGDVKFISRLQILTYTSDS